MFATLLVFLFHTWPDNESMFTLKLAIEKPGSYFAIEYLNAVVDYHQEEPSFATRPATTKIVLWISALFNISKGISFIIVSFALLYFSQIALVYSADRIHPNKNHFITLQVYALSFSILFAWFPNIFSYDEPLQYMLLFLSLGLLVDNKIYFSVLAFVCAVLVRENSIFLLPGFALISRHLFPQKGIKPVLGFGIASVGALVLKNMLTPDKNIVNDAGLLSSRRMEHLTYNFQNPEFTTETLLVPIITVLLPLTIVFVMVCVKKNKVYLASFLLTFVINTILVILLARAREARLFALPLIFIWPLINNDIILIIKSRIMDANSWKNIIISILLGTVSIAIAHYIAFHLYIPTAIIEYPELAKKIQIYFFISMLLAIVVFLFTVFRKRNITQLFRHQKPLPPDLSKTHR